MLAKLALAEAPGPDKPWLFAFPVDGIFDVVKILFDMPHDPDLGELLSDDGRSDYHPLLVSWKPLEQALRQACSVELDFYTDAASMINALKGILPAQEINLLHRLRMHRNELVHKQKVSKFAQTGATSAKFAQESSRMISRLGELTQTERQSAHNALLAGRVSTTGEEDAWRSFCDKLRELTSQHSPYECIEHLAKQAPKSLIQKLHSIRKMWTAVSHDGIKCHEFISEIEAIMPLLSDRDKLVAAKIAEDEQRSNDQLKKHWPGAGSLASEINHLWGAFQEWIAKRGGNPCSLFESINNIAADDEKLRQELHQIRILRNRIANAKQTDSIAAEELIQLLKSLNKPAPKIDHAVKHKEVKYFMEGIRSCPTCEQKLRFKTEKTDFVLRCPKCKTEFKV